jgi:ABC-type transport system substrate-binding protein
MAATFAPRASMVPSQIHTNTVPGWNFEDDIEITADNSYPLTATNGYPFTTALLQTMYGGAYTTLVSVEIVNPIMVNSSGAPQAFFITWDKIHSTIRIFSFATGAELANANAGANGFVGTMRCKFY